ncbi:MAG: DUF2339 domain-containing protein [Pseudomonadota bacterium]
MTFLVLIVLGGAVAMYVVLQNRIRELEEDVREIGGTLARIEDRIASAAAQAAAREADAAPDTRPAPAAVAPPAQTPAQAAARPPAFVIGAAGTGHATDDARPRWPATAPRRPTIRWEQLFGRNLPIWIGGAALVLAGFFLVRYSIEVGLLGPAARTLLAALFATALVGAAELALRLPATRSDPRVGQALAGAGVASAYGTLYMAAALYHLVGPLLGFAGMLAITAAALGLALRHGPPTAAMALIGGFVAPLVAGFDAAGVGPLLVYLALFIAALFGLAARRGWGWLAIAATAAGFGWVNLLVALLDSQRLGAAAGFTVALALGAALAFPAARVRNRWLRLAPLVAGFGQLMMLAPVLEFDALLWGFYCVLAAAALVLAWRDALFLPGAGAALALLLMLELLALLQPELQATPIAAIVATLLFAPPGHARALRHPGWAALAILGTAGPLLVAQAGASTLLPDVGWAALDAIAAVALASLAWRQRDGAVSPDRTIAVAMVALLAVLSAALLLPIEWLSAPLALALVGLAFWARRVDDTSLFELAAWPFAAALVAAMVPLADALGAVLGSLAGDSLPYAGLPGVADLFRALGLPVAATLGALLLDARQFGRARRGVAAAAIALALLLGYVLAKQPLAIATPERFLAWGFVERALLSQALLAAGWLLWRRRPADAIAIALLALGLVRVVWFDVLLFNPAWVAQKVGALPLANAAVAHAALAAFWFWTLGRRSSTRFPALALTVLAALAVVRQALHGTDMTGAITSLENGGYSAALLVLALFWLWRGIAVGAQDLRIAGLALLTLVTLKVFLIDAAALDGALRILSFLGLGVALIGIGWAYNRFLTPSADVQPSP